jgi:hypothetical protein
MKIKHLFRKKKAQAPQAPVAIQDSDGIPPGLDLELTGQEKTIMFFGQFYAAPHLPFVQLFRKVKILFAAKEAYVAFDLENHNLYVVDREKNLSLGCRMQAELLPADYDPNLLQPIRMAIGPHV